MRINRFLSICAVASRRKSDELILEGRVKINGKTIDKPGVLINPLTDIVTVDDVKVKPKKKVYYKVYKPKGIITTTSDEKGRLNVLNLFNNNDEGIFPVGRLDKDSEGLLFLTNDGDFANSLIHPKHEIEKVYEVIVNKKLHEKELDSLRSGVRLKEGKTKPCEITLIRTTASSTELIFVLKQGLNRQIRRMVETLEAEVTFLRRTFIGGIGLAGMKPGETRKLGYNELNELKKNANT